MKPTKSGIPDPLGEVAAETTEVIFLGGKCSRFLETTSEPPKWAIRQAERDGKNIWPKSGYFDELAFKKTPSDRRAMEEREGERVRERERERERERK